MSWCLDLVSRQSLIPSLVHPASLGFWIMLTTGSADWLCRGPRGLHGTWGPQDSSCSPQRLSACLFWVGQCYRVCCRVVKESHRSCSLPFYFCLTLRPAIQRLLSFSRFLTPSSKSCRKFLFSFLLSEVCVMSICFALFRFCWSFSSAVSSGVLFILMDFFLLEKCLYF